MFTYSTTTSRSVYVTLVYIYIYFFFYTVVLHANMVELSGAVLLFNVTNVLLRALFHTWFSCVVSLHFRMRVIICAHPTPSLDGPCVHHYFFFRMRCNTSLCS